MEEALYSRESGYYRKKRHPAQEEGDYVTGASFHPALASCVAACIQENLPRWEDPRFVDIGCGSGQLLANLLPCLPKEWTAVAIDLHDPEYLPVGVKHLRDLNELQEMRGVFFAYEFFDALPCDVLTFRQGAWHELVVEETAEGAKWAEGGPATHIALEFLERFRVGGREGQIVEVCTRAETIYETLARKLTSGLFLTFDYGKKAQILYNPQVFPSGTLMAYRSHHMDRNVLNSKGEQDITYAVNFTALEEAGERAGLKTLSFTTLGEFLVRFGIQQVYDNLTNREDQARVRSMIYGPMGQDIRVLIQIR
ncbi:MAG TPA: SAM-dependent methyltransferase [Thermoanaerobaculia bacterium]|nr:SAM-dependent methyltransferase [Thermoanaerobaculia bacterium]HUM29267.1 SAM-dependent methyltransferase [Thermoanaerobaculia bacterium]HXK67775.1 SAM-dependent methyltransferase [Thermoanaerobaculia bacterium]